MREPAVFKKQLQNELRIHKRTLDGGLAFLYHVYLGKLKVLYDAGVRFYHHWEFSKYWAAEKRILNTDISITLFPRDSFYFEFFTTGNPIYSGTILGFPTVKAACIGVDVALEGNQISLVPRIRTGERNVDGTKLSLVGRPFQTQLINEPTVNPPPKLSPVGRDKYPKVLYESYAPLHSHTGIYRRSYTLGGGNVWPIVGQSGTGGGQFSAGSGHNTAVGAGKPHMESYNLRDTNFDIPFMQNNKSDAIQFGLLNDGIVDWPRANGVVTIKSLSFGSREFAIYIDAFSQFSVFPTSEIGTPNGTIQNVPPSKVRTIKPTLPAWVFQMPTRLIDYVAANGNAGFTEFPEIDWKVHPDGTKACAVVHERSVVAFDTAYFVDDHSGHTYFNPIYYTGYLEQTGEDARQQKGAVILSGDRYFFGTGLVEATLTIEITGPDPNDFTFAVTVKELRRPTTSPYCTLLAGYTYYDIPNGKDFYARKGDLCVVDLERYYQNSGDGAGFINPGGGADPAYSTGDNRRALFSVKNYGVLFDPSEFTEVNTFPAFPSGVNQAWPPRYFQTGVLSRFPNDYLGHSDFDAQLIDFDIATLSFALRLLVNAPDVKIAFTENNHVSYAIYTFNRLRKQLFPETLDDLLKQQHIDALAHDFRQTYMTGSHWIFMPLNDNPDWDDSFDATLHSDWATDSLSVLKRTLTYNYAGFMPVNAGRQMSSYLTGNSDASFLRWWVALNVFGDPYPYTFVASMKPSWGMYTDLIMNALRKSPWSTFFVHPSGTWAFFDQSTIYNKAGEDLFRDTDVTQQVAQLEHCIFDWVHFEFTLSDGHAISKDTTFVQLYNDAILQGEKEKTLIAQSEVFLPLDYPAMRAVFYIVPWDGSVQQVGFNWNGATWTSYVVPNPWLFNGNYMPCGVGFANSGGKSAQFDTQHFSFASCLLIDGS
jgi:hypothetical protein